MLPFLFFVAVFYVHAVLVGDLVQCFFFFRCEWVHIIVTLVVLDVVFIIFCFVAAEISWQEVVFSECLYGIFYIVGVAEYFGKGPWFFFESHSGLFGLFLFFKWLQTYEKSWYVIIRRYGFCGFFVVLLVLRMFV